MAVTIQTNSSKMAELDEPLSDREQEVLELLAQGATNKELAASLFISPNTVKVHLRNINTKLGSRSRTEASRIAIERGFVTIPGMEIVDSAEPSETIEPANPLEAQPIPNEAEQPDIPAEDVSQSSNLPNSNLPSVEPTTPLEAQSPTVPRSYLIGGLTLLLAMLGLVAWFVFNRSATSIDQSAPFESVELGERWFTSRPLPESLSAASAVDVGSDIYLIGGQQSDGDLNAELHIFDSTTEMWRTGPSKPQPVANSAAVSLPDLVIVVGGEAANGQVTDAVEIYRPSSNEWGTAANLPKALSDGLAITDEAKLYYLGGRNDGIAVPDAYAFDPVANSWETLPDMPEGRAKAAGGVISGHLYVIGGTDETGEATADCFKFSLADQSWSSCSPMGNKRIGASGVVLLNKLYIIGGETGANFGELYNPDSDIWEKIGQPMLDGLDTPYWSDAGVTNVGNVIYVLGGEFNGTLTKDAYLFAPLVYQSFIPAASSSEN